SSDVCSSDLWDRSMVICHVANHTLQKQCACSGYSFDLNSCHVTWTVSIGTRSSVRLEVVRNAECLANRTVSIRVISLGRIHANAFECASYTCCGVVDHILDCVGIRSERDLHRLGGCATSKSNVVF